MENRKEVMQRMRKQHSVIQNKHMEKLRHKRWRRIASVLMAAVVFCTTYALILPAITMERTETHRQDNGVPESLTFSYADEGITGTITLPWSEELPEDLHCSVTKLDGTEDNYDALYQSASETFAAEEKVLSAIQIYQLHWQSAGEPYTLPQDSQPTVQLTAAAENEGKEPLTGLAFTEEPPADNTPDDSPAQAPGKELRAAQPAHEATTDAEETAAEPRYTAVPLEHDHIALGPSGLFAWARASAAAVGGHYYKRVDSIQEIQQAYRAGYPEKYVILYANSVQQALGTDQWYTAPMVVQPVKGYENEGYFELSYVYADGADGHFGYRGWQERSNPFDYKDRHWQIRPHPSNSSAFYIWANETWSDELWTSISDSNRIYLDHDDATNTWRIHGASYYMSYDEKTETAQNITDTSYFAQCNMLLFRYVGGEREVVDDISGSEEVRDQLPEPWTKPAYNDYRPVSQAKEGEIPEADCPIPEAAMTYASDPSTANIEGKLGSKDKTQDGEDLYRLQRKNDGRILTDKSVVYGADDYDAAQVAGYGEYEAGDFSVSLSALGQEWMVTDTASATTPADVVYVLDLSTSMNRQDSNGPRWRAAMEAINRSMKSILERNPQNRVGLVTFSNISQEVLPLDRYAPNRNGNFLEASQQSYSYSIPLNSLAQQYLGMTTMDFVKTCNIQTAQGLRYAGDSEAAIRTAGEVPVTHFRSVGNWDKTYTQLGLQEAYDSFLSMAKSSSAHLTFSLEGKTYARRPVIILVTDGDPTVCTYNYMYPKAGPSYGQGETHGVAGYYTLLSANYFKNLTSILYQKPAGFFTIGIDCTDSYTQAILEPTPQRVAAIATNGPSERGPQLYNLLENIGPEYGTSGGKFTQIIKRRSSKNTWMHYFLDLPGLGYNNPCIRGMVNPYWGNYNYCDKAWFGVLTEEDMNEAFSEGYVTTNS